MPPDAAAFVRLIPLDVDPRVVGFAIFAVLLAAVGFGLMPALQASRPNIVQASNSLARLDPGVRTAGILQLELFGPFRARGLDALKADPTVRDVAAANSTLIDGCCRRVAVRAEGGQLDRLSYLTVSNNWFSVFDLSIVRGRGFTSDEARSASRSRSSVSRPRDGSGRPKMRSEKHFRFRATTPNTLFCRRTTMPE